MAESPAQAPKAVTAVAPSPSLQQLAPEASEPLPEDDELAAEEAAAAAPSQVALIAVAHEAASASTAAASAAAASAAAPAAAAVAAATEEHKHQPVDNATMNLDRNEVEIVDLLDDNSEESSLFSSSTKNDDDIPLPTAHINFKQYLEREEGHDCAVCKMNYSIYVTVLGTLQHLVSTMLGEILFNVAPR